MKAGMDQTGWVTVTDICQPLDWKTIFGNEHPVEIDLGAGDGSFIAAYAAVHPERNFLATERLLGRARKIAKKAERCGLPHLKVLRLESDYTLRYLVPPASVDIVHLMFPDPWPKRKHLDRRMVQAPFVESLVKVLKKGGEFRWTTDHQEYFEKHRRFPDEHPGLKQTDLWDLSDYPKTDFQQDFDQEGRSTYRGRWIKL
jgi:tRNA (guanine-N7-)-methyltransferase